MPRRVIALAVFSGALLALCLPKPGVSEFGWFALAPLFYLLDRAERRRDAFILAWLAGAAFHAVAFFWIYQTCRIAEVPALVGVIAWSLLFCFQGLAWGLVGVSGHVVLGAWPKFLRPLGWAVVWTAVAVACERWTPRLPGDLLEYTQWRFLSLIQIAALGGPHALGFILVWLNAGLAVAWDRDENAAPALAPVLAALLLCFAYGAKTFLDRGAPQVNVRVEILQPNIDQYRKWDSGAEAEILAGYDDLLTLDRTARPALVVWPESALPYWVNEGQTPPEGAKWGAALEAAQLIGVVTRDGFNHFNSAVLISPEGKIEGTYHKRELVPFGEYVPFSSILRPLIGKLNELGGITQGAPEQPLIETPLGPAAATICYEAVFPRWARRDAARGARLLFNLTNDGWYRDTWGPYQHFKTNVFRAVENRVTVIRSGNTGISAVIDPWGVETAKLPLGVKGRLDADVPLQISSRGVPFTRASATGWERLALL